ncbi:MAG: hypothetical protein FWG63_11420 [Defluviitaleaceae bacterium]|nr:hypothetical protein [Defluviitaleaceae bacterium]
MKNTTLKAMFAFLVFGVIVLAPGAVNSVNATSPGSHGQNTWFESVYAVWEGTQWDIFGAQISSNAGENWRNVDYQLVRYMGDGTWRVDVPGLAADNNQVYTLRILNRGTEYFRLDGLSPLPFNRQGFAFYRNPATRWDGTVRHFPHGTTGGNSPDGSVAPGTEIWYITHENRNDLALLSNRTEPLVVRIIGRVGDASTGSTADLPANLTFQYHIMIENSQNITIEGVGPDAVIEGFGFSPSSTDNIIIRNLTFEHSRHDSVWLRGPSTHAWITHNTFTVSGDGASDTGSGASNFTISYNIYVGTIQTMLANGNDGEAEFRATYHGNWFFHAHSRHPLLRAAQAHVFNNLYDFVERPAVDIPGHSPGGEGASGRDRSSVIVEGNVFLDVTDNLTGNNTSLWLATQGFVGAGMIAYEMPRENMYAADFDDPSDFVAAQTGNNPSTNINGVWHGLTPENLAMLERVQGSTGVFGNHQEFIDSLVPSIFMQRSVPPSLSQIGLMQAGAARDIGNVNGDGNNIGWHINDWVTAFDPFNPRNLLPGINVMPASEVEAHVRAFAGTMRDTGAPAIVDTLDPHSHIQQPIITQMHINPDMTFYIRTARSPWATGYTWEWDMGTSGSTWEVIEGGPGVADAYQFTTEHPFVAQQGGTYQFRITAHNSRVDTSATSEVFTITHHYVNMATATPVVRSDLNRVVFSENFNGSEWRPGPIRNQQQLDYLGIGVRRFGYLFYTNINFDPNRLAAGVTHLRGSDGEFIVNNPTPRLDNANMPDIRRNDAYIVNNSNVLAAATFNEGHILGGRPNNLVGAPTDAQQAAMDSASAMVRGIGNVDIDGGALLLRDWNWNNNSDQERYATFMHLTLPEQARITSGRMSISYDFMLNRSHANMGAGIWPIQLYDINGNFIMRRTANGSPAINGDYNPGLSLVYPSWQADTNIWISIEVVLDFDEMEFDVWLSAGEGWFLYEYNVPIPSHIYGIGYILANTPTGNHANSTMNLLIDNIVVAVQ